MEGSQPEFPCQTADEPIETLPHLPRRLVGKCYGKDVRRMNPLFEDEVGHPVGKDTCLSAPGAGQDQERPAAAHRRFGLLRVELFKNGHCCSLQNLLRVKKERG